MLKKEKNVEPTSESGNDAKPNVSGSTVSEALSELLKVAASLLTVQQSTYYEDWDFSKSTTKKDRRKVIQKMTAHNEFQRLAAIKLKKVFDLVSQHCR